MNSLNRTDSQFAGFVFKGQLVEVALNRHLRREGSEGELTVEDVSEKVSLKELDADAVADATKMSAVYIAIASFENMVRKLISARLLEEKGANWWTTSVSKDIRRRAENRLKDEKKIRWHGTRGLSPVYFMELKDLSSIIQNNWGCFEDLVPDVGWVRQVIKTLERSRNVIMHSGQLSMDDIERVGMNLRDWVRQVGT